MDYGSIANRSHEFYEQHNLKNWAKQIPANAIFNEDQVGKMRRARQFGLDQTLILPPLKFQMADIAKLVDELAIKPVKGVPVQPQFAKPYVSSDEAETANGQVHQTLAGLTDRQPEPYILFFNLEIIPKSTFGKRANQIAKQFKSEDWTGLTAPELLVTQRIWREHQASASVKTDDARLNRFFSVWLIDSGDKSKCSAAFYGLQTIGVYGCDSNRADPNRGANISVVVPLT